MRFYQEIENRAYNSICGWFEPYRNSWRAHKSNQLFKEGIWNERLGKTRYYLGLQIKHCSNGILVHQSTYIEKVLKRFYMDKSHPIDSPMVVRSLEVNKNPYRLKEENEELFGPKVPYLSAIGALMYLAYCTRSDIAFSVNLQARYSSTLTKRHWNEIKHILWYLHGTSDMSLYYSK